MILIPKHRDLIVPVNTKSTIRGWYKLEAVNSTDGRRRFLAEFPNLITTLGANNYASVATVFGCCLVGSGSAAPTVGDTGLQTFVAGTNSNGPAGITTSQSGTAGPTYWGSLVVQYAFATGAAAGNLSEVGVGSTTTNGNLFSRALILDGGGAPTTITVLSTEALYVTYTLQQYAPTADVTGNVTIAGTVYAYTLRAANAGSATWAPGGAGFNHNSGALSIGTTQQNATNGAIGALTASPTGTSAAADGVVNNSYSSGSFQLTHTASWSITVGNLSGGISALLFQPGTHGEYQIGFSPAIPKDASHVLTLNVGHSWAINTP